MQSIPVLTCTPPDFVMSKQVKEAAYSYLLPSVLADRLLQSSRGEKQWCGRNLCVLCGSLVFTLNTIMPPPWNSSTASLMIRHFRLQQWIQRHWAIWLGTLLGNRGKRVKEAGVDRMPFHVPHISNLYYQVGSCLNPWFWNAQHWYNELAAPG